jgi:hypothetical protein
MSGYSILILICSVSLSHGDCQLNTALDVVRGPQVDNPVMCALNAQTMIARTNLMQADGSQYMRVLCSPIKSVDEWIAEIEMRRRGGNSNPHPSLIGSQIHFAYFPGADQMPESSWSNISNKSHTITAYVDQPGDGVLVAAGGAQGGYALFVKDGRPIYEYNSLGKNRYRVISPEPLSVSKSSIRVEFKCDRVGRSEGGNITMFLNDRNVAKGRVEMTSLPHGSAETFDVGLDSGSPVSDQYASPFKYTGVIDRVEVVTETKD